MKKLMIVSFLTFCIIITSVSLCFGEKCDSTFVQGQLYRFEYKNDIIRYCKDPEGNWFGLIIETENGLFTGFFRPDPSFFEEDTDGLPGGEVDLEKLNITG